jgi:phage gp46-like protein
VIVEILIRANEACEPDPFLLWDTIWNEAAAVGNWVIAGNVPGNSGGLAADAALETAVTLSLFSDAALAADHPLAYLVADGDLRGWWGDGIDVRTDLGERPLGSWLWVLERAPLTPTIARWAQAFAEDALAPLQNQGAVVEIDVSAEIIGTNELALDVVMYGANGQKIYDRRFTKVWSQLAGQGTT